VEFISARTADAGGSVSNTINPVGFSPRSPRIVILIHGYNVNRSSGEQSFTTFATLLQKHGFSEISVLGQLIGFLWPGDVNLRFISGLFYPAKIGPARDSAALLARFLVGLRGPGGAPVQIVLVAHSLGNRVALEVINDVMSQPDRTWGRMEGTCLMAAAVPVSIVSGNARLSGAAKSLRTRNFFSKGDNVLHWAFPSGETAAGEGFFPQAIGLFGNPAAVWAERFDMQPYDHGHYFVGKGSDDRSARYVAQFLGAAVPTQPSVSQPSVNTLPPANDIPRRPLGL
jgi:hypothetical protein